MRYSKEFKLECIRKYKAGEHIDDPEGCTHETFHKKVLNWVSTYDSLGEAGLDHLKPMLKLEDKLSAIRRIESGESVNSVALSFGRPVSSLSKWYGIYLHEGIDGLKSKGRKGRPPKMKKMEDEKPVQDLSEQEQIKILRKRLEELELENEYLKKLAALVQARKDRQRGKR